MNFNQFSLDDWVTVILIIAQAGVVYYRLKKVEQKTDQFNSLLIEFAVHKNSFKNLKYEFEKQSLRIENIIQRLDDRLLGIEAYAYEAVIKKYRIKEKI